MRELVGARIHLRIGQPTVTGDKCDGVGALLRLIFNKLVDQALACEFVIRPVPIHQHLLPFCLGQKRQGCDGLIGIFSNRMKQSQEVAHRARNGRVVEQLRAVLKPRPQTTFHFYNEHGQVGSSDSAVYEQSFRSNSG